MGATAERFILGALSDITQGTTPTGCRVRAVAGRNVLLIQLTDLGDPPGAGNASADPAWPESRTSMV